ncbi:hypothetical protein BEWA_022330 [Theileria equi strain WA]|uniref:RAP domain-containing protein n=1 Tax=Theileria equi strain WA TaxID=1537102 RepID=L0AV31_THEEQ|nr:hypothetical protein BEWA_022330 [Theileria equi strain WA]AFZ79385.1 hypothetical protein BEWA_022330 [Theileria equi strain WA]|eukprot:XP_004829051.1 hypothetical protein BEWA_022330 [Theileria equi strain WA]
MGNETIKCIRRAKITGKNVRSFDKLNDKNIGSNIHRIFERLHCATNNGYYTPVRCIHIYSTKMIIDNHQNMTLFEIAEASRHAIRIKRTDMILQDIISKRGYSELKDIKDARELSAILEVFYLPKVKLHTFYAHIVKEIMNRKLFPINNRMWISYFRFLGSNQIFHKDLFDTFANLYSTYLEKLITSNYTRILLESIAISSWAFAICAPNVNYPRLFDLILEYTKSIKNDTILLRIFWSLAIKDYGLEHIDVGLMEQLIDKLNSYTDNKRSLYQAYTILLAMKSKGIDVEKLVERCRGLLRDINYDEQFNKVSKSQRYVSDVLARLRVPHKLETFTDSLISIDIAICGESEKIAIEVDGPYHYILNCETMDTSMRTGTTLLKERLLKSDGWIVISTPPVTLDDRVDVEISKLDNAYRNLLLNSGSKYLNKLLG